MLNCNTNKAEANANMQHQALCQQYVVVGNANALHQHNIQWMLKLKPYTNMAFSGSQC